MCLQSPPAPQGILKRRCQEKARCAYPRVRWGSPCSLSQTQTDAASLGNTCLPSAALSQVDRNLYSAEALWIPRMPDRKRQKANSFVFWGFVSQKCNLFDFITYYFSLFYYFIYFFLSLSQPMICHYNQGKLYALPGDLDNIFYRDGTVRHYSHSQNCNGWLFLLVTNRRFFSKLLEKMIAWKKYHSGTRLCYL